MSSKNNPTNEQKRPIITDKPNVESILSEWWNNHVCMGEGQDLGLLVSIALLRSGQYWASKRRYEEYVREE
jgi:hypothetical protein